VSEGEERLPGTGAEIHVARQVHEHEEARITSRRADGGIDGAARPGIGLEERLHGDAPASGAA